MSEKVKLLKKTLTAILLLAPTNSLSCYYLDTPNLSELSVLKKEALCEFYLNNLFY